jgi:hypothetical protein
MNENILRQRRALRRAVVRSVILVALCAFAAPFAVAAQAKAPAPSVDRTHRPIYFAGGEKSRPLGEAATIGLLIPLRPAGRSSDINGSFHSYQGLVVEGAAGAEGLGVAAGWGRRLKERRGFAWFGEDVMATAFRTKKSLDGLEANTTYVGGEVGLTTLLMRVSVGAATRVSGPEWADRTIFTGGVGISFGR